MFNAAFLTITRAARAKLTFSLGLVVFGVLLPPYIDDVAIEDPEQQKNDEIFYKE